MLFFAWQYFTAPSAAEIEARKHAQDSIALAERRADSLAQLDKKAIAAQSAREAAAATPDSLRQQQLSGTFGPFSTSAFGKEETVVLENELLKITFNSKGGRIQEVLLKKHYKMVPNEKRKDVKQPLYLQEDPKNRFDYLLPIAGLPSGGVNTGDLYFSVDQSDNAIVFRADAGQGRYFEQKYLLPPNSYQLNYSIRCEGLNSVFPANTKDLTLNWDQYLDKIEKATQYERTYATVYFKPVGENVGRCSPTANTDSENAEGAEVKWVSHTNQFFNSTLFAETAFAGITASTQSLPTENKDLKKVQSQIRIPLKGTAADQFDMHFYIGPNDFDRLYAMGDDLEEVVPFGRSILGTINRWVIRPLFSFLLDFISSKGIVILILTLLVKLLLYPLSYRMLYSQAKMAALKPEMEKLKEKFKDDTQRQQMETMNLYREFGVNPLGTCMPMLLQMPIWIALYRFFPASIEFRQAGFLWANDLSSYDEFIQLPFSIPMGFGSHISLFTLLWVVTTLIYTWYNSKSMDFSANPALKYMQYIMPVMFMGFFNGYASGLTAYLLFSNVINILQTIVTKYFVISEDRIKREMEAYRKKPKKQGGFTARLEAAMKEQQKIAAEKEAAKKKKK